MWCAPMYEFGLGDGEQKALGRRFPIERTVVGLEKLDVSSVRRGGYGDHEIVHIREDCAFFDYRVERGDVDDEEQRGDG